MLLLTLGLCGSACPNNACPCIGCTACLLSANAHSCLSCTMLVILTLQLKKGFSYLQASVTRKCVCSLQKQSAHQGPHRGMLIA